MSTEWLAELKSKLGISKANLFAKYENAFSHSYQDENSSEVAFKDINNIEKISATSPIYLIFYRDEIQALHIRLFQYNKPVPLSDLLPIFENMDLRTFDERPYKVNVTDAVIYIADFTVNYTNPHAFEIESVKQIFQDAFIKIYNGSIENDGFNKLVLGAGLSAKEIVIFRAYAKYLRQTGFRFSQNYIEQALVNNSDISKLLISLFLKKFTPSNKLLTEENFQESEKEILQLLDKVTSLDEDIILRRMLDVIRATLRTNFFQMDENKKSKHYVSFKFASHLIPELPLPIPLYEIFVYSTLFEGIHLRNTKVARGGIRWSDRREDFRTEILGLMKAQVVKNAVIVPSGAKGGFVLKTHSLDVRSCYTLFIKGLLDITDNLKNNKIVKPKNVLCYDDDDPYLVVAADKGTATFSDLANSISEEYDFWLGDAFASGGSSGYDHKKMGITARGAWESVKRHFLELNIDVMKDNFSAVGIGDMSGDVFGNGLIYTPHIKLLAAFDHRNIFLDPDPDPQISFNERLRLFNLPTSSWEDYNPALLSKGGGVYKRTSKSISLSPEIKLALGIESDSLRPSEVIRAILKAPVDLLWNGGIGTYVKAQTETNADVGDKANEFTRVNGNELRCKVVGEGGNLGFTQLGRVEYSLNGGRINTDFIDNSGGVDCSDHEVNIKIVLNQEVHKGKLTLTKRNDFLVSMTEEVAHLVLQDNYHQALVISIAEFHAMEMLGVQRNYIAELETLGIINRAVDYLPDDKRLAERKAANTGLTRPELAILLAYTKIYIKQEILKTDLTENAYLSQLLYTAFPQKLNDNFKNVLDKHPLRREIVATQLSNLLVNEMGVTFVFNVSNETGATIPEIIRAAVVASRIYGSHDIQKIILSFNFKLPAKQQYTLLGNMRRLIYLSTRWFLKRNIITNENMESIIQKYAKGVGQLKDLIPQLMGGYSKDYLKILSDEFEKYEIDPQHAKHIAAIRSSYTALNIIDISLINNFDLPKTAITYFNVGEYFNLLWFRDHIANDNRDGYWETLSRLVLRDELDNLQKKITISVLTKTHKHNDTENYIARWSETNTQCLARWHKILEMVHSSSTTDYTIFFIALGELTNIIQNTETIS